MCASRGKTSIAKDRLELYDRLVKTIPGIQRKGVTIPYTSLNGNMFSSMESGSLALRLPLGVREEFLRKYETRLVESYGVVRKEYVVVPDSLLERTEELRGYFALSYEYAKTLKPKPTSRKK